MLSCTVLRISMHMLCLQGVAGRPEQLPAHETKFHMSRGVCSFLRIQTKCSRRAGIAETSDMKELDRSTSSTSMHAMRALTAAVLTAGCPLL